MKNYSKYRLNDEKEIEVYRKESDKYDKFVTKVYAMLDSMRVGQRVDVDDVCRPSSLDIFIKVVCMYILYRNSPKPEDSYIEFSDDYLQIIRQPGMPNINHYTNHFYDKE